MGATQIWAEFRYKTTHNRYQTPNSFIVIKFFINFCSITHKLLAHQSITQTDQGNATEIQMHICHAFLKIQVDRQNSDALQRAQQARQRAEHAAEMAVLATEMAERRLQDMYELVRLINNGK